MKVQAEKIVDFLNQIKILVFDINDTLRMGEDNTEETINYQVDSICKAIDVFKVHNLSPVTPIVKSEKKYAKIYDYLIDKADKRSNENIDLYKATLYFDIKRVLRRNIGLSECQDKELNNFIEGLIVFDSKYEKILYSNEWFYTSLSVIEEVAAEIIEHRRKAPQLKLF